MWIELNYRKVVFPAIWGNSTAQVMAFLDTWLASFLVSGSISYLYYANRIFQLPLALFAIALSTALFPSVAKLIRHKDEAGALREMKRGFWILLFLLSLATAGGIIFSTEIIWLLFQRGAFTALDTANTSSVLQMYMIGLLPFGIQKLLERRWIAGYNSARPPRNHACRKQALGSKEDLRQATRFINTRKLDV